jgi:hypothetical protein
MSHRFGSLPPVAVSLRFDTATGGSPISNSAFRPALEPMDIEWLSLRSSQTPYSPAMGRKHCDLAVVCNFQIGTFARTRRAESFRRLGGRGFLMRATHPASKTRRYPNLSFRVSEHTIETIERRAAVQSTREKRKIKPSQVARELIEYAIAITDDRDQTASPTHEQLIDEVMAAALFARRAFEIVLSTHEGLAEQLLRASRAEVQNKKARKSPGAGK